MSPADLAAIGKRLSSEPSARPLGGVLYVPHPEYQALLSAAQALYAAVTAPAPKAKAAE